MYGSSFRRVFAEFADTRADLGDLVLVMGAVTSFQTCALRPPSANRGIDCNRKRAQTGAGSLVTPEPDPGPLVTLGKEGPFPLPSWGLAVSHVS